ncbi:hypothetical protein CPC08DRAFT_755733 [Agrocybe pediades]|nr:hypothetical protein CPC08DRAFT_755733 [Agrocybe pediades]
MTDGSACFEVSVGGGAARLASPNIGWSAKMTTGTSNEEETSVADAIDNTAGFTSRRREYSSVWKVVAERENAAMAKMIPLTESSARKSTRCSRPPCNHNPKIQNDRITLDGTRSKIKNHAGRDPGPIHDIASESSLGIPPPRRQDFRGEGIGERYASEISEAGSICWKIAPYVEKAEIPEARGIVGEQEATRQKALLPVSH